MTSLFSDGCAALSAEQRSEGRARAAAGRPGPSRKHCWRQPRTGQDPRTAPFCRCGGKRRRRVHDAPIARVRSRRARARTRGARSDVGLPRRGGLLPATVLPQMRRRRDGLLWLALGGDGLLWLARDAAAQPCVDEALWVDGAARTCATSGLECDRWFAAGARPSTYCLCDAICLKRMAPAFRMPRKSAETTLVSRRETTVDARRRAVRARVRPDLRLLRSHRALRRRRSSRLQGRVPLGRRLRTASRVREMILRGPRGWSLLCAGGGRRQRSDAAKIIEDGAPFSFDARSRRGYRPPSLEPRTVRLSCGHRFDAVDASANRL